MTSMISKMARAIAEQEGARCFDKPIGASSNRLAAHYRTLATAALQALRKLTPAMRKAGEAEMMACHKNLDCFNDPYVDSTWQAMIAAAEGWE